METQEKSSEISHEIKNMSAEQVAERMSDMRKTMLTLEWDKNHNQINIGMEEKYIKLKEEYEVLEKHLNELNALEKEEILEKEEKEEKLEKEKVEKGKPKSE